MLCWVLYIKYISMLNSITIIKDSILIRHFEYDFEAKK